MISQRIYQRLFLLQDKRIWWELHYNFGISTEINCQLIATVSVKVNNTSLTACIVEIVFSKSDSISFTSFEFLREGLKEILGEEIIKEKPFFLLEEDNYFQGFSGNYFLSTPI